MNQPITIILFVFSVIGGLLGIASFIRNVGRDKVADTTKNVAAINELRQEIETRIHGIELELMRRCTRIETQLEVNAAIRLHQPHAWAARRDYLIEKHLRSLRDPGFTIPADELREFLRLLEGIIDGRLTEGEKPNLQAQEDARYLLERLRDKYHL